MKERKSHARIHEVILELREKSKQQKIDKIDHQDFSQAKKYQRSSDHTMQTSEFISSSETSSIILPGNYFQKLDQKYLYEIPSILSSQSLCPLKQEIDARRQIKTARPVSRRKITSKDKYSKSIIQKEEPLKTEVKKSQIFQQLQILQPHFFVIQKEDHENQSAQKDRNEAKSLKAFWAKSHIFVSLFPLEYTECIIYNHSNILPIYGEVTLKQKRFVVSNQYKNSSLKDLIKQFGPFEENICKNYLYQIVCGVEEMHNRKTAHNRLSSETILYNKQGQVFINVVKCTSKPLSEKEKHQRLLQLSPEVLLTKNKSNSLKNDVWSIGVILLDMLFDFGSNNPKNMSFHPYNQKENQISENDLIIVDNLKQLYGDSFLMKKEVQKEEKINKKFNYLSHECKELIFKCLAINKDERISIRELKNHVFFQR